DPATGHDPRVELATRRRGREEPREHDRGQDNHVRQRRRKPVTHGRAEAGYGLEVREAREPLRAGVAPFEEFLHIARDQPGLLPSVHGRIEAVGDGKDHRQHGGGPPGGDGPGHENRGGDTGSDPAGVAGALRAAPAAHQGGVFRALVFAQGSHGLTPLVWLSERAPTPSGARLSIGRGGRAVEPRRGVTEPQPWFQSVTPRAGKWRRSYFSYYSMSITYAMQPGWARRLLFLLPGRVGEAPHTLERSGSHGRKHTISNPESPRELPRRHDSAGGPPPRPSRSGQVVEP